ncbi:hypothetical protein [Rubrivirga marina]|uniref:DUF5666 domain-containing protein n=1 Tax=Rubrivirga marina TaxID=1196024 RepID=A0A271IY19_9BACT|nr:hypothetical protein [Rubrivirga marina]PAP75977.1 hypothetical protein BSZ37_05740 [Rubrivirga marina]
MDLVRIVTSFVLFVLSLTLAVCASATLPGVPEGPPAAAGVVASVRHSATASGVLVETGAACAFQAVADAETRVVRQEPSGRIVPAAIGAVAEGDSVAVYTDGTVMESCPLQGRAEVLVVFGPVPR